MAETAGRGFLEFGVECQQYAGDTQLYPSFPSKSEEVISILNQCLELVNDEDEQVKA